jgi:hypothetical protein
MVRELLKWEEPMWLAVVAPLACAVAAVAVLYILGVIDRSRDGITDF